MLEYGLRAKLLGVDHPIVCGNWNDRAGKLVFSGTFETTVDSVKIGVIAAMVPMVTPRMKTQAASAYLWQPPLETLREDAARMRPNVDLLIALTHIGHRADVELAQDNPGIDIILGGHSHTVIQAPELYGSTFLCQGGSHARFAGVYQWDGALSGGLVSLTGGPPAFRLP